MFYAANMWSTTTGDAPPANPYSGYTLRRGGRRRMWIPFLIPFLLMLTITIYWATLTLPKAEWEELGLIDKMAIINIIKEHIIIESPGCTGGQILIDDADEVDVRFYYKCMENGA